MQTKHSNSFIICHVATIKSMQGKCDKRSIFLQMGKFHHFTSKIDGRVFTYLFLSIFLLTFLLNVYVYTSKAQPASTTYRVATSGSDATGCGSESQPCRTIKYAVDTASSGATILVAGGTYTTVGSCVIGTAVICVFAKDLTILGGYSTTNWNISNPTANPTIIDGQNSNRPVLLDGRTLTYTPTIRLEGFTVQNGFVQGNASGDSFNRAEFGGGLLAETGQFIIRNMIFKDNVAAGGNTTSTYGGAGSGGGIALKRSIDGSLLENILFENNTAQGGTGPTRGGFAIGGGLYTLEAIVAGNNLSFINNKAIAGSSNGSGLSENNYADAQGGGAAFHLGSNATINTMTATGNQALGGDAPNGNAGGAFGGGLYAEQATVFFTNVDSRNNLSEGGDGSDPAKNSSLGNGGGFASSRSDVTFSRTTIINNIARGGSGDVYSGAGGGGGIYFSGFAENNTLSLINVIIGDNIADIGATGTTTGGGGGGIFLNGGQGDITHTTLAQNEIGSSSMQGIGMVILNGGTANITHSIIADHTQASGTIAIHAQSNNTVNLDTTLFSGNNTDTGGGGTFTGIGTNLSGNPDFVSAGSPNFNYHINNASAAIDQAGGSVTAVDIDTQSRALFGPSDVGADEYVPLFLTVAPNDQTLSLQWTADTNLLPGLDHYNIVVTQEGGASAPIEGPSPIDAGTATTFTLTGVTNDKNYTITIEARTSSNSLIASSNTVIAFPTDDIIYLPMIVK
jgi:hypothetical protein